MPCFQFCCDGAPEKHKHGAFVSPERYQATRIKVPVPPPYEHKPIPWVHHRTFQESYNLGVQLGQGAFGVVHEGIQRDPPHDAFAVKIILRQNANRNRHYLMALVNEVQILADLQHPNILHLHEIYKDPACFFLVLEKLCGGELFDRMCLKQHYNEKDARDVCRTIFGAMAHCHKHHVAHRDLKPENLLLKSKDCDADLKIADFGFAKRCDKPQALVTLCGTAAYMAPEILNYVPYDYRADNWSVGVILFMLLGGYAPFDDKHQNRLMLNQQIRQAAYVFHPCYWDGISPDAKRLIRQLLTVDMNRRLTMEQALEHPWIIGHSDDFLIQKSLSQNLEQFKRFNEERKELYGCSGDVKSVSYYWLLSRS